VDSVESARAALAGGADRLELCDNLIEGGTTPSAGMIAACRDVVPLPLYVMIRSRGGDFVVSEDEGGVMRRDVTSAVALGAAGIVTGALTHTGDVDEPRMRELVEAAGAVPVTFHRAFDVCRDRGAALDTLARLGVRRVLTSGGAATALEGADEIRRLVRQANGHLTIVAGGGINELNARQLVEATGVREIHVRCTAAVPGTGPWNPAIRFRRAPDLDERSRLVSDSVRLRLLRDQTSHDSVTDS
jgi:copper homeostasis protein